MSKRYAVVQKTDDYIICHGVYSFYEGVGHLIDLADEACQSWIDNGYKLVGSEHYFRLEADSGYGWYWKFFGGIEINEYWYLLEVMEGE